MSRRTKNPENFRAWKALENDSWKPSWKNFQKPEKIVLHDALLQEQGYVCCYCGQRIGEDKNRTSQDEKQIIPSHIEHLKPRTLYSNLQLAYANLIASCQGKSKTPPPIPVHCGHKKGDWYDADLMVSPLDPNCAEFFKYSGSGEILPTDDPNKHAAAEATIENLGLNVSKLQAMRSEALSGLLLAIDALTEEEIQQYAEGYQ
ncbi:retron system putative HNH endonuclease [Lusitaniella coriacea]|uniref:retron system putative HNH endonuclease n=1 Tax=Lusitaniella coriacea TaxID=1983105 RepID=UPI003CFA8402